MPAVSSRINLIEPGPAIIIGGNPVIDSAPLAHNDYSQIGAPSALTWTQNISADKTNSNIFVYASVGTSESSLASTLTATCDGTAMTLLSGPNYNNNSVVGFSMMFVAEDISPGDHTIIVTPGGTWNADGSTNTLIAGSVGINNCGSMETTDQRGNGGADPSLVVSSQTNSLILSGASNGSNINGIGTGGTELFGGNEDISSAAGNMLAGWWAGASSVTCYFPSDYDWWSIICVNIHPVGS